MGATRTSSIGGRPVVAVPVVVEVPESGDDDGGGGLEIRACASAITASARCSDCCRIAMLDCSVVWKLFSVAISPCSVAIAACRACACDCSGWIADRDCDTLDWSRSVSVRDSVRRSASFSGFGGTGGAGPEGVIEGSSSSNGEVRRSGVSCFGAGVGADTGAGAGVGAVC